MAKILYIEDDSRFSDTYNFLFTKEGHTLLWARDGQEGLAVANSENPDVILLDMMMPGMSGMDFLKEYKPKELHPDVKVVVFSNLQTDDAVRSAMELGADRYEIKATFSPKQLVGLVNELLSN